MIYVKKILLLLSVSLIFSQSDSLKWKHYGRIGLSNAQSQNGAFGYYRLNRKTDETFRDLRLFAYNLQNESFIYLRYKSSDKYSSNSRFYRYTTSFFRKNSQANLDLQYHVNQGFGIFLNQYENGLINVEIGHAFDMSNFLNDTRKTSYAMAGIFWDHDSKWFSSKIEFEHFQQISEIIENNLTRNQYLVELIIPMNQNISLNLNYEEEDYIIKSRSRAFSLTMAIEWKGRIRLKK